MPGQSPPPSTPLTADHGVVSGGVSPSRRAHMTSMRSSRSSPTRPTRGDACAPFSARPSSACTDSSGAPPRSLLVAARKASTAPAVVREVLDDPRVRLAVRDGWDFVGERADVLRAAHRVEAVPRAQLRGDR